MTTRKNFRNRREQRIREAAERIAAREKRSASDQLARLDAAGHRALKERTRLMGDLQ